MCAIQPNKHPETLQARIFVPIHFYNAQVLRNHRIERGDLWIADGKVVPPQPKANESIDLHGKLIAPGFIDLQLNGAFGYDITSNPEKAGEIAKRLGQYGVTAFLGTVLSSSPEEYRRILPTLSRQVGKTQGAELLGIHLEGPCFNPLQAKAHRPDRIKACKDFATPLDCYGSMQGVKMVTLAPELPGTLEWIAWLKERGIVISAGHSMATAEEMARAMKAGVGMATHLFNAMGPLHHRQPGMIGTVLNSPGFFYSILADGVHIDPLVLSLAWRCQPRGLLLVSDASAALGLATGSHELAGREVEVNGTKATIAGTDIIAGGVVGMDRLAANFRKFSGASLVDALEAVSLKPAKVLGIESRKGTLEIGADADFVILGENLGVVECYTRGKRT